MEDAQVRPWQAAVQAKLTRCAGMYRVEEIHYGSEGIFTRTLRAVGSMKAPDYIVVLNRWALEQLLTELVTELEEQAPGVDTVGVTLFVELVRAALGRSWEEPSRSRRFDAARFAGVTRGDSGILYGHLELGDGVAGTVVDDHSTLCFEQHLVVQPLGRDYRLLSAADTASLCSALSRALQANPAADPAWRSILMDAQAGSGGAGAERAPGPSLTRDLGIRYLPTCLPGGAEGSESIGCES